MLGSNDLTQKAMIIISDLSGAPPRGQKSHRMPRQNRNRRGRRKYLTKFNGQTATSISHRAQIDLSPRATSRFHSSDTLIYCEIPVK